MENYLPDDIPTIHVKKVAGTFERISPKALASLLYYDPQTGLFTWLSRPVEFFTSYTTRDARHTCNQWNSRHAGKPALTTVRKGYMRGEIFGKAYSAHECAWALIYGEWPFEIDHINGDRSDNRLCNLRLATRKLNSHNRKPRTRMMPDEAKCRSNSLRRERLAVESPIERAARLKRNADYMRKYRRRRNEIKQRQNPVASFADAGTNVPTTMIKMRAA